MSPLLSPLSLSFSSSTLIVFGVFSGRSRASPGGGAARRCQQRGAEAHVHSSLGFPFVACICFMPLMHSRGVGRLLALFADPDPWWMTPAEVGSGRSKSNKIGFR